MKTMLQWILAALVLSTVAIWAGVCEAATAKRTTERLVLNGQQIDTLRAWVSIVDPGVTTSFITRIVAQKQGARYRYKAKETVYMTASDYIAWTPPRGSARFKVKIVNDGEGVDLTRVVSRGRLTRAQWDSLSAIVSTISGVAAGNITGLRMRSSVLGFTYIMVSYEETLTDEALLLCRQSNECARP